MVATGTDCEPHEFTARSRGLSPSLRRGLAFIAACIAFAAPAQDSPVTAANVYERRVPVQRWPRLGPKAVGLLMSRASPWGHAGYLTMLSPSQGKELDALQLYVEGRSPGVFKFAGPLPPLKPAQLVRVTVNGGKGYFGDGATYSDVEVLDGTPGTPIVLTRAMDEAKARWDRYFAAQKSAFDRVLDEDRRRVEAEIAEAEAHPPDAGPPRPPPSMHGMDIQPGQKFAMSKGASKWEPDQETVWGGFFPSWRDDPGEFTVLFAHRVSRQRIRQWMEMQVHHCPPGAPCVPPHMGVSSESKYHGAAIAYAVTFDRAGNVIQEEPFPPVAFHPLVGPPSSVLPSWHPPPTVQPPRGGRP